MGRGRKRLSVEEKRVRLITRLEKKLAELRNPVDVAQAVINPMEAPVAGSADLTQTAV